MNLLFLLALAVAPGLAIAMYIYNKDKFDKEPMKLLEKAFFFGVFSIVPAIILESIALEYYPIDVTNLLSVAIGTFLIIGLAEEGSKYFFLRTFAYTKKAFNEPYDGIVYSVMIAMGFATIENVKYVFDIEGGLGIALLRMFTAVPAHAIFGIIMGYYVGRAKFEDNTKFQRFCLHFGGLMTAVAFHGGYNFFLFQQNYPALGFLAFAVVFVGAALSRQAIKVNVASSPFKKERV